jgi:acyl-CoA thioester hydrolase
MQIEQVQAQPFHVRATIPADYLDIFGHMNIQYYFKIFNEGIFHMFAQFGMDDAYFLQEGRGIYALEQYIRYMAEVREGETVATYSRFYGRNEKRIHCMHIMVNESQKNIAAILEGVVLHVDRQTKRSLAFPNEIAALIDAQIATDNTLEWDAPRSQPLGI